MWMGKSYQVYRHTGRMVQDSSMRMSNRAEVGFGLVSVLSLFILVLGFIYWIAS